MDQREDDDSETPKCHFIHVIFIVWAQASPECWFTWRRCLWDTKMKYIYFHVDLDCVSSGYFRHKHNTIIISSYITFISSSFIACWHTPNLDIPFFKHLYQRCVEMRLSEIPRERIVFLISSCAWFEENKSIEDDTRWKNLNEITWKCYLKSLELQSSNCFRYNIHELPHL